MTSAPPGTLGDTLDQLAAQKWTEVPSVTRKGLLCALVDVDPMQAVLEECGPYTRLRVQGETEARVTVVDWPWGNVWTRLRRADAGEYRWAALRSEAVRNTTTEDVAEIRACQDCPCCYVDGPTDAHLAIRCSARPTIELANGELTRRHPDCPLADTAAAWPGSLR